MTFDQELQTASESILGTHLTAPTTGDLKAESLYSRQQDKRASIDIAKMNKELTLRKDEVDYGDDNWLIEAAKTAANELLPHSMQLAV